MRTEELAKNYFYKKSKSKGLLNVIEELKFDLLTRAMRENKLLARAADQIGLKHSTLRMIYRRNGRSKILKSGK